MILNRQKLKILRQVKRFLPFIFVSVIIFIGISIPVEYVKAADAIGVVATGDALSWLFNGVTTVLSNVLLTGPVGWIIAQILYILSSLAALIMTLSGLLFDHAINFSLNQNLGKLEAVKIGWKITRDLANIAFIFIILYIAIATILQIAGHGVKDLLIKVIIVALLINFSLVFTKVIIDASNVLANEFYSAMRNPNDPNGGSISATIMSGLDVQKVFDAKSADKIDTSTTIQVYLFSIILYLATAYIFFGGAFLFVARMIVFIFLMVLAPVAFISMILPKTQALSKKWWSALFSQAFVAPAYLFLIYVVVSIIKEGFLKGAIGATDTSGTLNVTLILNFVILIGLMWGSIKVAKEIGGQVSAGAFAVANKVGLVAGGFAGGVALSGSKRGAGFMAEKALSHATDKNEDGSLKNKGFIANTMRHTLRQVPLTARGLGRASSWREQQLKKKKSGYEKEYKNYSDAGLRAIGMRDTIRKDKNFISELGLIGDYRPGKMRAGVVAKILDKNQADKQAEKRKKENIEREDKEENEIKSRMLSNSWVSKGTDELKNELVKIEAELAGLTNISAEALKKDPTLKDEQDDINKKRTDAFMRKAVINQEKEDRARLRQIEENKEKRTETEKAEERVSKVEGASGEKKEKSSPTKK